MFLAFVKSKCFVACPTWWKTHQRHLYATKGTPSSLVAFSAAAIAIASVTWTFFDRQDRALSYWADGGDGFTWCSANCRHMSLKVILGGFNFVTAPTSIGIWCIDTPIPDTNQPSYSECESSFYSSTFTSGRDFNPAIASILSAGKAKSSPPGTFFFECRT